MSTPPALILASTSAYRRDLLQRLALPFAVEAPGVDESPRADESGAELARRLAQAKAQAVAARHPGALVIGSDQVALLGTRLLGKPGTAEAAIAQLMACSGRTVEFATAICLVDARGGRATHHLDRTQVRFRTLSDAEVQRYVKADSPLDCAGGFRCEALGIALFDGVDSQDPTALVGLPLIATARLLRDAGLSIP